MSLANLTIRRRLFFLVVNAGAMVALASAFAHYTASTRAESAAVDHQMTLSLEGSVEAFQRTYVLPLMSELRLLESSPEIDRVLMAFGDDMLVDRPPAEQLLQSITKASPRRYLSLRFIDGEGVERIVIEKGRRQRRYRTMRGTPVATPLDRGLASIFAELSETAPGTVRARGLIRIPAGGYSFLMGISKHEPDIGGFGGALVAHVDLKDYLEGLARREVFGRPIVWVLDRAGRVVLRPPDDSNPVDPRPHLAGTGETPGMARIRMSEVGPADPLLGLFRVVLAMPPDLYRHQLRRAGLATLGILILLVVLAAALAYLAARQFSRPLTALLSSTEAVAGGSFDVRLSTHWGGEFGQLARAFNRMVETLRQTTVSKNYADNILRSMSDMLVVTDRDLRIRQINAALLSALDHREADLRGKPLNLLLADEDVAGRIALCAQGAEGIIREETALIARDGRRIPVSASAAPMRDSAGRLTGVTCVAQDITERQASEQALKHREEFERLINTISTRFINLRPDDVDHGIEEALGLIGRFAGASRAYVFTLRPDGRTIDNTHEWCAPGVTRQIEKLQGIEVDRELPWFWSRMTDLQDLAVSSVAGLPQEAKLERAHFASQHIRSLVVIPMVLSEALAGFLGYDDVEAEREWSDQTLAFLRIIGEIFVNALARKASLEALQESENRYHALYDSNPSTFLTLAADGTIRSVNRFGAGQLGYAAESLMGTSFYDLLPGDARTNGRELVARCIGEPGQVHHNEERLLRRDGSVSWSRTAARAVTSPQGDLVVLLVCEDVTDARRMSDQLAYQASHDLLTGLKNRKEFERRLAELIEQARQRNTRHALFFLDLDQFKVVNDICGHVAGDELLRQLGAKLSAQMRHTDLLARIGGDEFAVLLENCSLGAAQGLAQTLLRAISDFRFSWEDKSFALSASIGVVTITQRCENPTALLSAADAACFAAKEQGRNRVNVYREDDTELAMRQGEMQWVARINEALEYGRFVLYFQPIVPLHSGLPAGLHYELLLRMLAPDGKHVPPGAFLPAAERYGLASRLDRWVLRTALRWLEAQPGHLEALHLCDINLSGLTMGDEKFLEFAIKLFEEVAVPPEKICFELTETAAITNLHRATQFIHAMKSLGCSFALDDFGSGLSSFAYLKNLPVDFLKIDGMFVRNIDSDPVSYAMVRAIEQVGRVMGKKIIAEFVESDAIRRHLGSIGVDYGQGYGIARPRPVEELLASTTRRWPARDGGAVAL